MQGRWVILLGLASLESLGCQYRTKSEYLLHPGTDAAQPSPDAEVDGAIDRSVADRGDALDTGAADRAVTDAAVMDVGPGGLPLGASCTPGSACGSGQCVDGVCCESVCTGPCEACNEKNTPGRCVPVMGTPRGSRTACSGTGACAGQCDGLDPSRCKYPGSEVSCTAGSCLNGMATTASVCSGAGACTATMTLACASNLCADPTKCSGGCDATHLCASTQYCDSATGACLTKKANGTQCQAGGDCATGNCVDNVCCESACTGQCQACGETATPGKCVTVTGTPRGTRTGCAGASASCRGTCNGTLATACTFVGASTTCVAATCASGQLTAASVCDGAGGCTKPATTACHSNQCADGATCLSACSASAPCGAGTYCDSTGVCQPKKANSALCTSAAECANGNCVDSVCCDGACTGQCESCNEPTLAGKCTTVTGNPRGTRTACAGAAPCKGTCGGTDATKCKFPAAETACAAGTCLNGSSTTATTCNGAGACTMATTMQCASNQCADTVRCSGGCSSTAPCATTQFCNSSGVCVAKKANASACQLATECTSGNCADGVCCNLACTGQCEACAESTALLGQCVAVTGNPRGTRSACTGATCRGMCNGTLRTACIYPGSEIQCTPASCMNAMGTTASVCNSAGGCTNAMTAACRANQCLNTTTCLTTCSTTQPCATGSFCDANGVCQPKKANGAICASGAECTLGNCIDGVCCESTCTGPCLSCALTGTLGLCKPILGKDDTDLTACPGTCDATGACHSKRGQTCQTTAAGCVSGTFCADGFCCNTACTNSCEVCSATPGTCTIVSGTPRTGHPACTPASICGGMCLGTLATCSPATTAVSCRTASCANAMLTNPASCDGAGFCPAATLTSCSPYNSCATTTACANTCTANTQCVAGAACVGGHCTACGTLTVCSNACANLTSDAANCGACGHSCQGGTCSGSQCQPKSLLNQPIMMFNFSSLQLVNGNIYALVMTDLQGSDPLELWQIPTSGTGVGTMVCSGIPFMFGQPPQYVAVSTTAVYWIQASTTGNGFDIVSSPLSGCNPASPTRVLPTARSFGTDWVTEGPFFDPAASELIWLEQDSSVVPGKRLMRSGLTGANLRMITMFSTQELGLFTPPSIGGPTRLFWFVPNATQTAYSVFYVSTTLPGSPITLTSNLAGFPPLGLPNSGPYANDTSAVWFNFVAPLPLGVSGGGTPPVFSSTDSLDTGVVDSTGVMYGVFRLSSTSVSKCTLPNCVPTVLVPGQSAQGFVQDATSIYWVNIALGISPTSQESMSVLKLAK